MLAGGFRAPALSDIPEWEEIESASPKVGALNLAT